ncbi:hypothetical protein Agub_g11062, partial [Astrephomene gubernaculifera]
MDPKFGARGLASRQIRTPLPGHGWPRAPRQPRLRVTAFKDWFNNFVQQQQQQRKAPQTLTQEQPQQPSQQPSHQQPAAAPAPQPAVPAPQPKVAPKRDFLEARQVSLFQLFDSSDFRFDIPPYQRPYAWRNKQMYELLQDFLRAYQNRQEYFLGAIVATRAAEGAPYQ